MVLRLQRALPFLLVMAVAVFLWTVANDFDYRPRAGRPGPDIWPKIVLGLMFLAAAWGAMQALLAPAPDEEMASIVRLATRAVGREDDAEKELEAEAGPPAANSYRALGGIAALLLFVGLIDRIGFALATFGLMVAVMKLAGLRSWVSTLGWSFVGTAAFFVIFQKVAYISLPLGMGPFREASLALMALIGVR